MAWTSHMMAGWAEKLVSSAYLHPGFRAEFYADPVSGNLTSTRVVSAPAGSGTHVVQIGTDPPVEVPEGTTGRWPRPTVDLPDRISIR